MSPTGATLTRLGKAWPRDTILSRAMMDLAVQQITKDGYGILPAPIEFQQSAGNLIP